MTAEDAVWAEVMNRFGYRCGCRGQCGTSHRDSGGWCKREHRFGGSADLHLLVVPIDPHTSDPAALPPLLLMSSCRACEAGRRRAVARDAGPVDPDQLDLFGDQPEPCETPPCAPDPAAAVSTREVIRVAAALTAAHDAGIHLPLAPNPHVRWDPLLHRYVAADRHRPT